ncbi:coniferyl aldehyde dehydrogenase [Christiangramia forsetii]|uniref:Aldehyde dehydrogenase n=2 Tax=Christiangramia forsetii TaxID=411153 RepID=A0LZZ6_CHRFK|nr:coniferyl aldehyde dehydrogenase [Christiangramia forsetii]GGG45688.1 aldehyde dehydrogenase [Christiangramia forsetii]CAL65941.1 NADP-dependent aldehyde dehydrogenase [Christiangramia forsetii KT0803]
MNKTELNGLLERQQAAFKKSPPDVRYRLDNLKKLSDIVDNNKDRLINAVYKDFGIRSKEETLFLEIFPLQDEIRHAMKNLRSWAKRRYVQGAWFLLPSSAYYQYQGLGSVGIMGAWNYQVLLTLSPLVDAIAAGNHAILKPSEMAPASAEVIKEIINSNFAEEYIHCVTGDAELAKDFSSLPFDHLFFTGSTKIGKLIMAAAAPNLTPVTLELGGKSPAIIHNSYSTALAARRIMAGKLFNCGQTCVAPDYVIMPQALNDDFEQEVKKIVKKFYPDISENEQYSRIINSDHFKRLNSLLKDAEEKGARIVELSDNSIDKPQFMTPKLVFNVNAEMELMQEEIFGPILPVLNLETPEEAVDYVNDNAKPLALYYFDDNTKRINWLLKNTLSGGVTINDSIYHLAQHNLPFGGVGASGMGHYHGYDGFKTFSKKRAVMHQKRFAASDFLHPPFTDFKRKLITVMGKLTKV